jgi:hypothetical protein
MLKLEDAAPTQGQSRRINAILYNRTRYTTTNMSSVRPSASVVESRPVPSKQSGIASVRATSQKSRSASRRGKMLRLYNGVVP